MAETAIEDPLTAPPPAEPTLPDYSEMIMAAIEAMNDKNGSNKTAIAKYIESTYNGLPETHTALLALSLNKLKAAGRLVVFNNNYMKPDPNAPPRRGRGRPPKPKTPAPAGIVASPPRPRGRPPKPRDPFAAPAPAKVAGSGRPRGRPPKKAKTDATPAAAIPPGGAPRGRGRPPKVKPAAEPVAV